VNIDVIRGCYISAEVVGQNSRGMTLHYRLVQYLQSLTLIQFQLNKQLCI